MQFKRVRQFAASLFYIIPIRHCFALFNCSQVIKSIQTNNLFIQFPLLKPSIYAIPELCHISRIAHIISVWLPLLLLKVVPGNKIFHYHLPKLNLSSSILLGRPPLTGHFLESDTFLIPTSIEVFLFFYSKST